MGNEKRLEIMEKLRFSAKALQNHPDPRVNRLSDLALICIRQFEEEVIDEPQPRPAV